MGAAVNAAPVMHAPRAIAHACATPQVQDGMKHSCSTVAMRFAGAAIAALSALLCPLLAAADAYQQHQVFFQNTEYELNIYRIYGEQPGKTMLIIGGIQGDEPGGYLAADLYVEMSLRKGNLIVVPRANFCSILLNVRGVNGDMNRKFETVDAHDRDAMIIQKLKELIAESDLLLNLHEGSGFYSDRWESAQRNPLRYGQSVIADCDRLASQKYNTEIDIETIARNVCARVNREISDPQHHFHFNNHRTAAPDTPHKEQRKSATYFAMKQIEIPAFGIETSKAIPSARDRVRYQSMVINAFMEEFGIVPEHPGVALPDPVMKYLFVSVNEKRPIVVYNGETLFVNRGDAITVLHVEANYERGLTVNVEGIGSYNDLREKITIDRETEITVKKDNLNCGKVRVAFGASPDTAPGTAAVPDTGAKGMVSYLIMKINNQRVALRHGERQRIHRGDRIVIEDLVTSPPDDKGLKVNFKGFVGNPTVNDAEDRGYLIDTGRDLLQRFSENSRGKNYMIEVTRDGRRVASFFVDITE